MMWLLWPFLAAQVACGVYLWHECRHAWSVDRDEPEVRR